MMLAKRRFIMPATSFIGASRLRTAQPYHHWKCFRAWALKETAMNLYTYVYEGPARKHFQWWYGWAVRSRLAPMKEVAGMMKRRFANIITYLKHRITNATSESINAKIQWVKYTARGFRNKQNFINAIYFHCGGLDLAPAATT